MVLACKALGGDVAKGAVAVANDDAGGTKKPRLMRGSSGAAFGSCNNRRLSG